MAPPACRSRSSCSVTLRGPAAALAALGPGDLTPTLDVSGLGPGSHTLTPTWSVACRTGWTLLYVSPGARVGHDHRADLRRPPRR